MNPLTRPFASAQMLFGQMLLGQMLLGLMLFALAACAPLPDFGAFPEQTRAPPPTLLPLDDLLARANAAPVAEARAASLSARAARLRARAALMRGPVNAPDTRARLAAAITRGAA